LLKSDTIPGEGERTTSEAQPAQNLVLTTPLGMEVFAVERIVWCNTEGKNATVCCVGETMPKLVFHALAEICQRFGDDPQFVRCHRSRLVNMAYCKSWKHAEKEAIVRVVYGEKTEEITVSRTYKADFVRRWEEFVQRQ
jgi:DNA-binding LytR/AlgR family response regulator